jgi:DNA-directed RNA polymerase subunit K
MKFTRYEKARMIGARALQISMGAPFLVKLAKKDLIELKYNPVEIAKLEYEKDALPITIKRPMPDTTEIHGDDDVDVVDDLDDDDESEEEEEE